MTKLEAYNEAKDVCTRYLNYKGDKRRVAYKYLQHLVIDMYMNRMNNFGRQLGLPTFNDIKQ